MIPLLAAAASSGGGLSGLLGGAGGSGLMEMLSKTGAGDQLMQNMQAKGGQLSHDAKYSWQQNYRDVFDDADKKLPGLLSMMQGLTQGQQNPRMNYGPMEQQNSKHIQSLLGMY